MRARGRPGLAALFDVAGADGPPKPSHLGFFVGPRINAGGRIGDAALGAKLLALTDAVEARRIAENLDRLNRERQVIEMATLDEALAEAFVQGAEDESADRDRRCGRRLASGHRRADCVTLEGAVSQARFCDRF